VLESILRSISSEAFRKPVRINVEDISRKFSIKISQLIKFIELFEWNGIIKYTPEMTDAGINFLTERMHFTHLPIDFEKFIHRKEFAFNKLDIMQGYAETGACKRSFILNYFGENTGDNKCGNCSSCLAGDVNDKLIDSREQYIKNIILRAVAAYNEKFGRAFWIDYFAGAANDKIRDYGLEEAEFHASLKNINHSDITRHIDELIMDGLLELSNSKFPILRLTRSAQLSVLALPVFLKKKSGIIPADTNLFSKLRQLRNSIAQRESILPSAIISDDALRIIAAAKPASIDELIRLDPIGKTFADKYGRMVLKIIHESNKTIAADQMIIDEPNTKISGIISMIKSGQMLSEIASTERKSLPEIANLLESEINSGLKLNPEDLIEKSKYSQISILVRKNRKTSLRQIRATIDWEIEFPLLRILVAIARNTPE
jgi:ATP-dependent DNA helicase RecQ